MDGDSNVKVTRRIPSCSSTIRARGKSWLIWARTMLPFSPLFVFTCTKYPEANTFFKCCDVPKHTSSPWFMMPILVAKESHSSIL